MAPSGTHLSRNDSASAIETQLERILQDPGFKSAPQLSKLLRYLVTESLAGRAEHLKATSVAHGVFGRDESFDAQTDTIVRVEAGRLRRRLARYYEANGQGDPIVIGVPKGGYAPSFSHADADSPETAPAQSAATVAFPASTTSVGPAGKTAAQPLGIASLGVALIALLLAVLAVWLMLTGRNPAPAISSPVSIDKPLVMIHPLSHSGDPMAARVADHAITSVVSSLTKVGGLSVMAHYSTLEVLSTAPTLAQLRERHGVSHVLDGRLTIDQNDVRIYSEVVDTASFETVWAEEIAGKLSDQDALVARLSSRIATALSVTLDPDEHERIYLLHSSNRQALELFRYTIRAIYPPTPERVAAARDLYLRVLELDPKFAGGSAGLSLVHSYRVLFEQSEDPREDLAQAIEYARQAIAVDPGFGMGHAMLGVAYTLSGQYESGLTCTQRAVGLEPGDPLSHQWLALSLIRNGRAKEAIAPLKESLRLDPLARQMPYLPILGMAYYLSGQYEQAIQAFERDQDSGSKRGPYVWALQALSYEALGQEDKAQVLIPEINADLRRYQFPIEHWLTGMINDDELRQRSIDALYRLGMQRAEERKP